MAVTREDILRKISDISKRDIDGEGDFVVIFYTKMGIVSGVAEVVVVKDNYLYVEPSDPDDEIYFSDIEKVEEWEVILPIDANKWSKVVTETGNAIELYRNDEVPSRIVGGSDCLFCGNESVFNVVGIRKGEIEDSYVQRRTCRNGECILMGFEEVKALL